jgi:hypothetical protein
MTTLVQMWKEDQDNIESKKLHQLISFTGDGKIETENTSKQLRDYFSEISSNKLFFYIEECLVDKFENSGFVLQDLINEIGRRLDFDVVNGRYRGRKGQNGFDGKWTAFDDHTIIVESKTSDAYRIKLDKINEYKQKLIQNGEIRSEKSSILIIVGREDTGDLEAQIRGSKYAWDIRLISVNSLIQLLKLKETFNDSKTIYQIYEVLKPQEYTKIDKLIDLIFLTAQDAELDDEEKIDTVEDVDIIIPNKSSYSKKEESNKEKTSSKFHQECIDEINNKINVRLKKKLRTLYSTDDLKMGVVVSVSKKYKQGNKDKYWFAYHPYYKSNLNGFEERYIVYACGSEANLFLIPVDILESLKERMWSTEKNDKIYWHINIFLEDDGNYYLQLPNPSSELLDLTQYKI